jgi:hypothetical protein
MWELWPVILVGAILAYGLLRYRETFVVKYGNPFDNEDLISFDKDARGTRLFAFTPDTCPKNKSDLDAGLCYQKCDEGYHGVGPVCWANSQNVGIGKIPKLDFRMEERTYWGSIGCSGGRKFRFTGYSDCYKLTVPIPFQVCESDRELYDMLCYKKCPRNLPNRIAGMPYLCYRGGRGLSYGRGVGEIPPIFKFGE